MFFSRGMPNYMQLETIKQNIIMNRNSFTESTFYFRDKIKMKIAKMIV